MASPAPIRASAAVGYIAAVLAPRRCGPLLTKLRSGEIEVIARDLSEPSPMALEVLSARPYAYLDDAPLEERRTRAVFQRRWLDPETAADIGRLDQGAIDRVRSTAHEVIVLHVGQV